MIKNKYYDRIMQEYSLLIDSKLTLREIEPYVGLGRTTIFNDLTQKLRRIDVGKYEKVIEQFKENHKHLYEYNKKGRKKGEMATGA